MKENYSNRILKRIELPMFRVGHEEKEKFLEKFNDNSFAYVFQLANSNGEINVFGNIDPEQSRRIQNLNYETNIQGLSLAYLDALIELMKKREWPRMSAALSVREIESFLRDSNISPAIPEGEFIHHRVHELVSGFEEYLHSRFDLDSKKKSPIFHKYDVNHPKFSQNEGKSFYETYSHNEQFEFVDEILEQFVREELKKDGGDIGLCHVSEGLVSIEYRGSCVDCTSSLGSTLDFIQKTLRFHLQDPNLLVVTDY